MDLHDLRYSAEHLWVRLDDDNHATIGVTEEALEDKNDITKIRLPSEGDEFSKDEPFGRLGVSGGNAAAGFKLYAPLSGEIIAVNDDLVDAPEAILEDPYEEGWLVRMEISAMSEYDDLMTREEYDDFVSEDFPDEDIDDDDDELDGGDDILLDDDEEDDDDDYDDYDD